MCSEQLTRCLLCCRKKTFQTRNISSVSALGHLVHVDKYLKWKLANGVMRKQSHYPVCQEFLEVLLGNPERP